MRIALAQIDPTLGDFTENGKKIVSFTRRALEKRADVVVFSEMALFGYPANDVLEYADVVDRQIKELSKVLKQIPKGITAVFGAVVKNPAKKGKPYFNAAVVARKGMKPRFIAKQLLPSYDVFDESRFFESGAEPGLVKLPGLGLVGISVCEDMWAQSMDGGKTIYANDPVTKLKGARLLINISSSPFSHTHLDARLKMARRHVSRMKVPFVYVNQVGGQDELIFEGQSFILDAKGRLVVRAAACEEDLVIADLASQRSEHRPSEENGMELLRKALVLGIRDFVKKTGQKAVHLGLSGGIDSALLAALSVDALGPGNVTGFLLPGPYSSEGSITDAKELAGNLGIKTHTVEIKKPYEACLESFQGFLKGSDLNSGAHNGVSLMEQNLQARLRGLVMMGFSNATGSMLLTTVNKSELASGYGTLYGDLCGGLAPLADLKKEEVYALARHYNSSRNIIPEASLNKAPSAELAPDQKDQDNLPPYEALDEAVYKIVEMRKKPSSKTDKWLRKKLSISEFKRWQTPPILRISDHAFGRGRRMPIAFKAEK